MHAILRVDLQFHAVSRLIRHVLVNLGRAESALGACVLLKRDLHGHVSLVWLHLEMRRLVVLVIHPAPDQILQQLKRVDAVWLRILDPLALLRRPGVLAVAPRPPEGPGLLASGHHHSEPAVGQPGPHAGVPSWLEVPHSLQLLPHPRALHVRLVPGHLQRLRGLGCVYQRLRRRLASEHAGLHGGVAPLDLGDVEESRAASCKHASGERQLRHCLHAPLVQDAGAVRDALAAFQDRLDTRMVLEPLELLIWAHPGVAVAQAHHHAYVDQVRLHVVDEGTAVGRHVQRPPDCVDHGPGHVVLLRDLPHLLDPEAVVLW
mmetsp:Transcript_122628/g.332987  ORF Transcript_122628/g.332987 Transcript_122628/m.332987 type:complete len:318 (-) Transcript_122628:642-1595(-)